MSGSGAGSRALAARMDSAARGGASLVLLGPEDNQALGVAALEFGVGLAGLRRRVNVHGRCLGVSVGDQACQLGGLLPGLPPDR
jgi:hypothetical protein